MTSSSWRRPLTSRTATNIVALSQLETLLVSSSGDVLLCRDQEAEDNQQHRTSGGDYDCLPIDNCDDLSTRMQETSFFCDTDACTPWQNTHTNYNTRGGLLGGAPPHAHDSVDSQPSLPGGARTTNGNENHQQTTSSPSSPRRNGFGSDSNSLYPIQSFDYSHFHDGMNDMLPERGRSTRLSQGARTSVAASIPGIPSFHSAFAQIRVTHVSAHPLGGHVLLISHAGLLYSYGLNDFGQLGVGLTSPLDGLDQGYIREPTIVTPLVEHGGKAIACAAGVDHSLVVIATKAERLVKTLSMPSSDGVQQRISPAPRSSDTYQHQVYAFGRNNNGKLGLVRKNEGQSPASVPLPHRVALHCRAESIDEGVVFISASLDHSMALVRCKADVKVYTWGSGPACHAAKTSDTSVPRLIPALSVCSKSYKQCILSREAPEFATSVSTANDVSFVTTSAGRCFVWGSSDQGMLGLGKDKTAVLEPTLLPLPAGADGVASVSAGAQHAVAVTTSGQAYAWGDIRHAGLTGEETSPNWTPQQVHVFEAPGSKENSLHVMTSFAGYDSTIFVTETGDVFSGGVGSGRLGVGETYASVQPPCRLFGGLRLCCRSSSSTTTRPQAPHMAHMTRGATIS